MRILLIGNFAPPYEEENLHNFTLLNLLRQEGNDCRVINISESRYIGTKEDGIINIKNYLDFMFKFVRHGAGSDVIHFLTKGYTRPGLMKLVTTVALSKLLLAKSIITLHAEMFSVFGRLRSKMGGQQLLHLSFSLSDKVICGDKHTCDTAAMHYKIKDKFAVIPSVIRIPEDIKENELSALNPMGNKKRVIVFSDIKYPSLLFDVLNNFLTEYSDSETGFVVSFSEGFSARLRPIIEKAGHRLASNIVFLDNPERRLLSITYANADFVLRSPSCDGRTLFEDIAFVVRRAARSAGCLHFPVSILLLKEGDVTSLCAGIFNNILTYKADILSEPAITMEDYYRRIKDIYSK